MVQIMTLNDIKSILKLTIGVNLFLNVFINNCGVTKKYPTHIRITDSHKVGMNLFLSVYLHASSNDKQINLLGSFLASN